VGEINVSEIIAAVGEGVDATRCHGSSDCQDGGMCLTHDLWTELSHEIDAFLGAISLESLVSKREVRDVASRQDHHLIDIRLV
jgi:Rrf2 family iron-sulfur cluster assembly transcriptional regulator